MNNFENNVFPSCFILCFILATICSTVVASLQMFCECSGMPGMLKKVVFETKIAMFKTV